MDVIHHATNIPGKPIIIPTKQASFQSPPPIPLGYFRNIIKGRIIEPIPDKDELTNDAMIPVSPGNAFGIFSTFQKDDAKMAIKFDGNINLFGMILCSRSIVEIVISIYRLEIIGINVKFKL